MDSTIPMIDIAALLRDGVDREAQDAAGRLRTACESTGFSA